MATMIGAYFGKGADAACIFDKLTIADDPRYREHLNRHNVIYLDFSEELTRITQQTGERFIFVFDEWDCIFHKPTFKITDDDRRNFIGFLAALTKGRAYVELTYMTGILPIAKYSSGSSLNHFEEHDMAKASRFDKYFGFTEEEVDELYERYAKINGTMTGPYDEIARYIVNDVDGVKKDAALLINEDSVEMDFYNAVSTKMQFASKDEIFSPHEARRRRSTDAWWRNMRNEEGHLN